MADETARAHWTVSRPRFALITGLVFLGVVIAHLISIVVHAPGEAPRLTQSLLMPTLILWFVMPLRQGRLPRRTFVLTIAALACSWIGDTLPGYVPPDLAFVAMIVPFFVAQLFWIAALWPERHDSLAYRRWQLVLPYLAAGAFVIALTAPFAGALLTLIVPYSLALIVMAVLATSLGPAGAIGGLLFMFSDSLIAIFTFAPLLNPGEPTRGLSIMSSYAAAQALIVLGLRRRGERDEYLSA